MCAYYRQPQEAPFVTPAGEEQEGGGAAAVVTRQVLLQHQHQQVGPGTDKVVGKEKERRWD